MPTTSSEELIHQIVFRRARPNVTTVSCRCRAIFGKHNRRGGEVYEPMDWPEGQTAWQVYNQPENHYAPFTEKDRIKT